VATPEVEAPATGANRIEVPIKKATGPGDDKIHVWPHLVRAEFLIAIGMVLLLIVWSLLVDAPLEEPANPTRTPNPSKAPWYFLGLQEMLVFFDPWHAGVVLPSFIILGLMVIPYIDINPKGNGYYCFKDRKWEILTFIVGFHVLWVSLIVIGTFLRGPGWNWFCSGTVDPKICALTNVDLLFSRRARQDDGDRRRRVARAWLLRGGLRGLLLVLPLGEGRGLRRVHGALGLAALRADGVPLPQHVGRRGEDAAPAPGEHQVHHGAGDAVLQHQHLSARRPPADGRVRCSSSRSSWRQSGSRTSGSGSTSGSRRAIYGRSCTSR
jgi:hypothetical protein